MQYGLMPNKAWVIRPAVDPHLFCPVEKPGRVSCLKLITAGSLIWTKGFEFALVALQQLLNLGVEAHLNIIGDGPEDQRVRYTIQDLGLERNVALLGRLSPGEVRDKLQEADVFLLSSLSEGISNAVLEGMACGLPVVTTDCGGMSEAVEHGVEGFVVPVREPERMAEALGHLAADPELRRRMGVAARERVLREFTLEKQTQAFVDMFQTVLRSNRAA